MARTSRQPGFTLIEVLCVCAVVALLSGLLLPAMRAAREAGRGAACSVSLRQLQVGNESYAADWRGFFAPGASDFAANRMRWFGSRAGASGVFDPAGGPLSEHTGGVAGRRCPTLGASSLAPGGFERACGGYGYNNAFVGVRGGVVNGVWSVITDRSGAQSAAFGRPAMTLGFADSAFWAGDAGGRVIEYSFIEPRRWAAQPTERPDPSIHFRHGQTAVAQAAWLDGHVSGVTLAFSWNSGLYGVLPPNSPTLGWPGERDDNSLFGGR